MYRNRNAHIDNWMVKPVVGYSRQMKTQDAGKNEKKIKQIMRFNQSNKQMDKHKSTSHAETHTYSTVGDSKVFPADQACPRKHHYNMTA